MVKDGYKQTDIGVIPDAWEVKRLKEVVEITSGESPSKFLFLDNGVPYYKVEQLNNSNKYLTDDTPYFIDTTKTVKACSIIFPKRGAAIFLNKIRLLAKNSFFDTNLMALTTSESIHDEYLFYYLSYIGLDRVADTTSIPQINNKHINPFQIPIPPKEEQKAIAKALSDTDELITTLEKLISKKEAIKQGTMQQLLTGKKRLSGFSGEWEEKRLGNLCEMSSGGTPSTKISQYYNGNIPWLSISDITNAGKYITNTERKLTSLGLQNSSATLFNKGILLLAMYASIGKCCIAKVDISTSQAILGIKTNNQIDTEFLYYYFLLSKDKLANSGQQGTQSNLNKGMVEDIKLNLPKVEEQQTIAKILSDMDNEIESLKSKLSKTKAIKDGIMSELLTGKTRLKVKDE